MKKTIALCMIVKNEEDFLRKCLDSVKGKVDQIIIVDTGSTDNTISIAKEYTKDVFEFNWINDFSAARNESIKHANTDYILVLDADEYLDEGTELTNTLESQSDYYFVKIYNVMSGGRAMTHTAIRIFKNNIGLYYRNKLHEHLNTTDNEDRLFAGYADFEIVHTGYTDEMMKSREKGRRNLPIMEAEVNDNPSAYNLFNMGRTYMMLGEHVEAVKYLKEAYPKSKNLNIAPELIVSLCKSLGELKRHEEALIILKEAVEYYPGEVDLRHVQAIFYMEIGYVKDAIICMYKCLEIGDKGISHMEGNGTYIAHYRLAEWYMERSEYSKAYDHIIEATKFKNDFVPLIGKYFEITERLNLPYEEVFFGANKLFKVTNSDQLKNVLEVLYQLRHPLLQRYLETYQVTVQKSVQSVALLFSKEYQKSRDVWYEVSEHDASNYVDMLLLSLILKDEKLFMLSSSQMNLSLKELKALKNIILLSSQNKFTLTKELEDILLNVLVNLMRLQEFEKFEELLKPFLSGGYSANIIICEKLINYGFNELAIDLLSDLFDKHSRNIDIIKLLGDVCMRSEYYDDAKLFYTKRLNLSDHYSSYECLYELANYLKEQEEKERLTQLIRNKFPLCIWIQEKNKPDSQNNAISESNQIDRGEKNKLIDLIDSVEEGLDFIVQAEKDQAEIMIDNCNYCLSIVSENIPFESEIQGKLQKAIMSILYIKPRLDQKNKVIKMISETKELISRIKQDIIGIIVAQIEVVFMPYKASMWDSFDSIYRAAINDPECEVYVVPIPYYEKNEKGELVKFCYEGNELPDDVITTPFEVYDLEKRKPDIIYIHNPFDGYNTLTMVNPQFFSQHLSKYTDMLVYVPYYVAGSSEQSRVSLPSACNYVNKIVVQSPTLKKAYINSGIEENKLLDLGSPKIDAALKGYNSSNPYLNLWKEIQFEQKVFLFNTGIADLLSTETWYSQIEQTLNYFMENPQFSLIWRPHPLTEVTLRTMRPQVKQSYAEIKLKINEFKNIFIDGSQDAYPAIQLSNALISDYSSIMLQYIATGKPVLGYLSDKMLGSDRNYFADYLGCYLTGEGDTISQFVEMVDLNQDFKKEERIDRFIRSITNPDGTSGDKIHSSIKHDLSYGNLISLEKEKNNVLCES